MLGYINFRSIAFHAYQNNVCFATDDADVIQDAQLSQRDRAAGYKHLDRPFFRFVTVHAFDRRTDGPTDRRTDGQPSHR